MLVIVGYTEEAGARTEQSEEAEFEAIQFACVEREAFSRTSKFVLLPKLKGLVLGLSRVRRRSSRLFSSRVWSVRLLLWKGCRVGDGWSVQQCFEASDCWLRRGG